MQWIQYSLDVLDWLHGRPPARSAEQVSMWNCLHLLTVLFGVILWGSTAAPHGLLFGTRAPSTQRPGNKSTMTHCNLGQRVPALRAISWQCGCHFHVPVTSNPCCVPACTPHYFLFAFPLCLWPLLLLSLYPFLSQESWVALFIYHCSCFGFKRHPQLGDGREMECGGEWMLPWVPGSGSVENFKLCQAKQGRPAELQRPTKCKEALQLPGEDEGNLLKTLKWHFCFLPVYHMNPTGVLLPGVKKVFTNRSFHLAPPEGLENTGNCSESHMASVPRPCGILQPSSFPKPQSHFWLCTWTLGFIYSSSAPREGLHIHQNIFTGHRFQVPLDAVLF